MTRTTRMFGAVLSVALLAACGGGSGGGGGSLPSTGGGTQPLQTAKVSLTIMKPPHARTQHGAGPRFVSPNTQSIVFTLSQVNGGAPPAGFATTITVNTTPGGGCVAATGGYLQCTANSTAPVADDTFTVQAYSGTGGTGSLLSSSLVAQVIVAGTNSITLTLNPVVASLAWSPASATAGNGTAAGNSVTLEALDATGAIIIPIATGSTEYQIPLYLKADGQTIDYIGWTCGSHVNFFTDSTHVTQAQGKGSTLTDGTSLSSPDSTQTGSNHQVDPAGASIDALGNNGTYVYYDGTAQTASTASLTCSATDSQAHSATFTLSLQNGSVGWTVDGRHR